MADEQHSMDKINDLVNLAYIYQQDGASVMCSESSGKDQGQLARRKK